MQRFWNQISWPSINYCFEQTCRQSRAGRGRRPAQPGLCRRPARPGGDSGLCRPNSASCCLAGSAGRPGLVALSGTRCDSIREPDRGGKRGGGGRGEGEGEGERDEEGRGANDMVSWRHVLSRALRYMHGPQAAQGSSASARAELRRRAHRAK